ncbi:MAG: ABC transporter ATP-binding protein [Desulfobacterales bacterium]|nr:ABC transporter ATP-binding protein [Desulfobacterales bacterium]MDD4073654.1 ABC transporter ATP-binding protein [Desulfobacterales bacterium]MDD4402271.1 ABC transporter ATP-binding protein [Desulfitobacteriaceae bacterium]
MDIFKRLIRFLRPYWMLALAAPLLMALEVVTELMLPKIMQHIIDTGVANSDLSVVIRSGILMSSLAFIGMISGIGGAVFAIRAAMFTGSDIRSALFKKIQGLSFGNLDRLETGQLVIRLTNDVTQVQEAIFFSIHIMIRGGITLVGSVVMAFITSPNLGMIFFLLGPIIVIFLIFVAKRSIRIFTGVQEGLDRLNTVIVENFSGMRLVKSFVRMVYEKTKFGKINDYLTNQSIKAYKVGALTRPFMMLVVNMGIVCAIWFGGLKINTGSIMLGQLIAFVNYLMQALMSIMMVGMLLMRISRASASAKRIDEVFESRPEIQESPTPVKALNSRGRLCFENVSFSYNFGKTSHTPILKNINFTAEPGETVAVVGATGSGKTSLINLIPRFYDVTEGRITLDNVDIRDFSIEALRKNIGISMQNALLFSGTIQDNIKYGRPDAADDDVIRAACAAQAHGFITLFPDGYDSRVGQRGVNLSGGQKQRIAIARALLIDPAILILDDSTSAVDVETEGHIQDALSGLKKRSTSFIVAQRVSTILNADRIIVLDNGMIAAEGDHDTLLQTSPIYREIYDSQLGKG